MVTPTSASIIGASRDTDLLARAVALGSTIGLSQAEVERNRISFAHSEVNEAGDTIASIYEYAVAQPRYRVGEDPSSVTDEHILYALNAIKNQPNEG